MKANDPHKIWRQERWLKLVKAYPRGMTESLTAYVKRLEAMLRSQK
jgi:hypothetical protein